MSRSLIVNGDDFASAEAANRGVLRAFKQGILTSTNLMVPCAWFPHAAQIAKDHNLPCGVHLTLTCEYDLYHFGPLTRAPRLSRDGKGYTFIKNPNDIPKEAANEVYDELAAQIQRCIEFGIRPLFLDAHMGAIPRWDNAFLAVAKQLFDKFQIPFLRMDGKTPQSELPLASISGLGSGPKERTLKQNLRAQLEALAPGTHWMLCHPAEETSETLAMQLHDGFAHARLMDLEALCDKEVRNWLDDLEIQLTSVRALITC